MIDGIMTKPLTTIADERGWLFEILRSDDDIYAGFGQVYLTSVYPGVIKAWHCHKMQSDCMTVVSGMVKLVAADLRDGSPTKGEVNEFFIGDHNRLLIRIPPGIHHGIKGLGSAPALVINCPDRPFDHENPDEIRLPFDTDEISYDWQLRHG